MRTAPPTASSVDRYNAMVRALEERLDSVVASSVASSTHLNELASTPPLKTGAEFAIERVEHEVSRLASIAAEMAVNTQANAEIARAGIDQAIALHETTREGFA